MGAAAPEKPPSSLELSEANRIRRTTDEIMQHVRQIYGAITELNRGTPYGKVCCWLSATTSFIVECTRPSNLAATGSA